MIHKIHLSLVFTTILLTQFDANAQNKLLIPDTLSGTKIDLVLQEGQHSFYPSIKTNTMGANQNVLGPTILLNSGDFVDFSVENKLKDTTTIHWHGLHVAAKNDGGPHTYILPNDTWKPSFKILDDAATYWYHPHLHKKTDLHVSKGIAGLILVRDKNEAALALPRSYGVDDFPLVIQTKDFDSNKQIVHHSNNDDVVMVNATIDPFLDVPAQVIRYRLLNGSSQRVFNLGLSDGRSMFLIASDGGLLTKPVSITRLVLAPGERAEVLISFSEDQGKTISLMSYASGLQSGIYGATNPGMGMGMTLTNYKPNALNGADFKLVDFKIGSPTSGAITSIPSSLVSNTSIPINSANITRSLTLSPEFMGMNQLNGNFLINNTSFDMGTINYRIPLNNIEIWSIRNMSGIAHPFHIHDVQFYLIDRNGVPVSDQEAGRKDVVLIKPQETVRFITKFEDFADTATPYMYHCHMLKHEDDGMMGQFIVYDTLGTNNNSMVPSAHSFAIYPNPAKDFVEVHSAGNQKLNSYQIRTLTGTCVKTGTFELNTTTGRVNIKGLAKGMYLLHVNTSFSSTARRIIIQ